ncbi:MULTISPECIES: tetratricopeptide repeat protein [Desulfosediminicola]|uniref:tetratricopeptide repeat protein n=1 Tax=Desulfosediminicola TaxID=2886823 RepID=UPI0010AC8A0E|nr:tetratricopeptide repeat protein [Desulfosediminicola ganghwensis]
MKRYLRLLTICFLLPVLTGCATGTRAAPTSGNAEELRADRSCAYFYFLWGSHAEYASRFDEAFEAYQKALICDPQAIHIEKKIPVLYYRLGMMDKAAETLELVIARDPGDISQHLLLAHIRIQLNQRQEAIRIYRSVLKQDPENEGVQLRLGILLVQQDDYHQAEDIFQDLVKKNPELQFAQIYLARLLHLENKYEAAAKVYEKALQLSWSPELSYELIDFYESQELYGDVLRLYDTIIANDNNDERAILGKIQTLLSMQKDSEALSELRTYREEAVGTERLDMAIAKILLRLDQVEEAVGLLELLRRGELSSEANYLLGLVYYQDKHQQEALRYLQGVTPGTDQYPDAVYLQVRIYRDLGMQGKAVDLLHASTGNPAAQHPLFYALLSSIYQEQERIEEAMASITAGTAIFPDSEQLHFEHALLLERSGLQSKAVAVMQRVLELSPDHPEALNYIGYTWADQNINLDEALEYILRAVQLKPDNGFIRDSLGWVHFRRGEYHRALQELQTAIQLEPADPNIYDHLGDVYRALNQPDKAKKAYSKGLEMFDNDGDRAMLQKKLNELSSQ